MSLAIVADEREQRRSLENVARERENTGNYMVRRAALHGGKNIAKSRVLLPPNRECRRTDALRTGKRVANTGFNGTLFFYEAARKAVAIR